MNFAKVIFVLFVIALCLSCSSNDDQSNDNTTTNITYNGHIKSLINNNCNSCHGSPTDNGAPMPLTTYTEVKNAVENRNLINRINNPSNPMPMAGLMTQANRDLVQQWVDGGFLEN